MLQLDKNNHYNFRISIPDNHIDTRFKAPISQTDKISTLTEMLSVLHNLFVKHNILYFITGGVLLGAMRDHSLIPWDNDNDLGVLYADHDKIMSLDDELPDHYQFFEPAYVQRTRDCPLFFQFYPDEKPIGEVLDNAYRKCYARLVSLRNGLYTDLFHYHISKKGQITNISNPFQYATGLGVIFPLKRYRLDRLELFGPHQPDVLFRTQNNYADDIHRPDHAWCCLRKKWVLKAPYSFLNQVFKYLFGHPLYMEYDQWKRQKNS